MKKTVWITGASSGIGKELALQYAAMGFNIVISARRKDELEKVAKLCNDMNAECMVLPFDLENLENISEIVSKAISFKNGVDILINNGGISQRGYAIETPITIVRKIMEVNFFAQVALTNAVVPYMINRGGGQIAVISSLAGKFGFALRSTYSASKHALLGYFESLGLENRKHNVFVSLICPGRVFTNISYNAIESSGNPHNKLDEGQKNGLPVNICAQKIIKAISQRKREAYIGKMDVLMVYFKRYLPFLFYRIALKLNPEKE
ncbi:MAG: SDR family oxidoreductase [Bacteroidetes bacterium]|nr:SDR family oxidoreductase [Bacteroidota bacterium]